MKSFTGILQADPYGGYNPLFKADRDPVPLTQALCWAHARRKFFVLADIVALAKQRTGPRTCRLNLKGPESELLRLHRTDRAASLRYILHEKQLYQTLYSPSIRHTSDMYAGNSCASRVVLN